VADTHCKNVETIMTSPKIPRHPAIKGDRLLLALDTGATLFVNGAPG